MSIELSIHKTYGALFIGYIISTFMYGVFCAQMVWYYRIYPEDRRSFKALVGIVWAFESLHCMIVSHMIWDYLIIRGLVDPAFYLRANWSLSWNVVPTEVCVNIVESFYIMRIWNLTNKNKYTLLLFIPVIFGTAHDIGYMVTILRFPYFAQTEKSRYFVAATASSRALTDIIIAVTMCGLLYVRRPVISHQSQHIIKALLAWTLATGVLTSVLTFVYLTLYITMPDNFIYIAAFLIHGRMCANTLLANLNTRKSLRSLSRTHGDLSLELLSPR